MITQARPGHTYMRVRAGKNDVVPCNGCRMHGEDGPDSHETVFAYA